MLGNVGLMVQLGVGVDGWYGGEVERIWTLTSEDQIRGWSVAEFGVQESLCVVSAGGGVIRRNHVS